MNQNGYYIAFDENGTPYIEHGIVDVKMKADALHNPLNKSHKYLMRIIDNGKYRYFYTQGEIQAWQKSKSEESSSDKSHISVAEYTRQKALDASTPKSTYIPPETKSTKTSKKQTTKEAETIDSRRALDEIWNRMKETNSEASIAKTASRLDGADKYNAYLRAAEKSKANPSAVNLAERDQLRREWLKTRHGQFVLSASLGSSRNAAKVKYMTTKKT